jgi:hypothetical protein
MIDFPTINRFAVILVPTEACLEWVRSCPGDDMPLGTVEREPTVYLIPESDAVPDAFLRRHYKAIFEGELNFWYTDPDMWPKDRSFKTFKTFFTVQVSTMVFDLGKGMILQE